jgi:flagellar motor switch protein FliM
MIAAREIQPYDARCVRGLSSASRRLFDWWMKGCAVRGNEVLAGLGIQATLTYDGAVAKSALDVLAEIPDPDLAALLGIGPKSQTTVLSFKPGALLAVLHGMMGAASAECPADRHLTSVEQSLAEVLYGNLCREWSEAWPQRDPLALTYQRSISRTTRARVFDPAVILLATKFQLETTCGPQVVMWMMPLEEIEQLCAPAEPAVAAKASGARISDVATLVPMPLSVELGRVQLSVLEADSLKCGDVLVLDQGTRSPLTARVAGQPKYQGRPGRTGSRICFAIDAILED